MNTKSTNINPKLNLNINKDDNELNDFLLCWQQFGARPNKILIHNTYSTKLFIDLFKNYIQEKNYFTEILPADDNFIINDKMFVKIDDDIYCSYIIIDRQQENSLVSEVTFFYKDSESFKKVQAIIQELNGCLINFEEDEQNKVNTVSVSSSGFELEPLDICEFDLDNFDGYYHKETVKDLNKLIKDIKKEPKGLSVLHGERGTGKTTVINYLSTKLDRIIIYIPNNVVESTIGNPEFRKFLKRFYRPILIIDDCEMLFNEFFPKSNVFTNNVLQMVDGFLSDTIEVNVVAIFNLDSEDDIDENLLEANNLLKVVKFESLLPEEATELSEYLNHKKQFKNKTKVIDVVRNRKPNYKMDFGL